MAHDLSTLCEEHDHWNGDANSFALRVPKWDTKSWVSSCEYRHPVSTAKDFSRRYSSVLVNAAKSFKNISMDPEVLGGTPRIAGTRIPVYMILDAIEYYGNLEGALVSYPNLTKIQVSEAMGFAAAVLENPVEHES